jgi:hypothetical protein
MVLLPLFGILIGVAFVFASSHQDPGAVDRLPDVLCETLRSLLGPVVDYAARWPAFDTPAKVIVALVSITAPGLFVLAAVRTSRAAAQVRRNASFALGAGGLLSFLWLPASSALLVLLLCLLFATLIAFVEGTLFSVLLIAVATVIGVKFGMNVLNGQQGEAAVALSELETVLPGAGDQLRPLLTLFAMAPFAAALHQLLHR